MLYRTDFDENGRKTLCQMDGVNADMLMDIFVQKLAPGDTLTLEEVEKECAVLLLSGQVTFAVGNSINETCKRKNPFEKKPYAVHFCRGTKATVTAIEGSQVLVKMTDNDRTWAPEFYHPGNCLYQEFGKGQWNGTGHRRCSISRGAGPLLRLTTTPNRRYTITCLITRKASAPGLRATPLIKHKTVTACAFGAATPTSRSPLPGTKCIMYG